jgi:hypothetical protein
VLWIKGSTRPPTKFLQSTIAAGSLNGRRSSVHYATEIALLRSVAPMMVDRNSANHHLGRQ